MSWSWRKLLLLRPLIQECIWSCIGDGRTTFMWFDKWCAAGPLSNIISSRDITRAGFNHASKVRDCIQDGLWIWPNDWLVKYPILNSIPTPVISDDNSDSLEWSCRDGAGPSLATIITHLLPISRMKSSKSCIGMSLLPKKGTPSLGLWYPKCLGFDQKGYSDSDYAGCNMDKKGTSGACQLLGGKFVCWSARKQQFVAMSLAEAEYVAVAGCCANILWMKSQLTNYDIIYEKIPIFCNNTSAIAISNNPVLHLRTKHIDIRYHFIRDHILKGDIRLHFFPTQYQLADIFTKLLDEPTFR
nr:retrovirus-related Pol polyprotein from transposon TNT 1-94 [Tanacetum cinerariifolium]